MYKSHEQRKVPIKAVDLIYAVSKTQGDGDCLFPETILKREFNLPGI